MKKFLLAFLLVVLPARAQVLSTTVATDEDGVLIGRSTNFFNANAQFMPAALANVTWLPSMAALRALPVTGLTNGAVIGFSSYYGDGNGGTSLYMLTNTVSGTNAHGGRVLALGGTKSWMLQTIDASVLQFGAKGDNSNDDTASFQAAGDWCASQARVKNITVPPGNYIISSVVYTNNVDLIGEVPVERASYFNAAKLQHKLGATNHMFIYRPPIGSGFNGAVTVRNLVFQGKSEQNLNDPKTITAVSAGNRLTFTVSASDVPTYSFEGIPPYMGWVGFYNETNRWMGSGMLQSVNTNTGVCTLFPGTDNFATPIGGTDLIVGWKVCFPKQLTVTNWDGSSVVTKWSSAAAGYAMLWLERCKGPVIEHCAFNQCYVGIVDALGDTAWISDCEFQANRYTGGALVFTGWGSDAKISKVMANAPYYPDDGLVSLASSVTNAAFLGGIVGWDLLGSQAYVDHIILSRSIYGMTPFNAVNSYVDDGCFEGNVREPLWVMKGNSVSDMGPFTVNQMRVTTHPNYDVPGARGSVAVMRASGSYSRVKVNALQVSPFFNTSPSVNWGWTYLYDISNGTSNQLSLGTYVARGGMVTNLLPGSSLRATTVFPSSVTVTAANGTEPSLLWNRQGVAPFGTLHNSYLQFLQDYNSDGVWEHLFGANRSASVVDIRYGNTGGESSSINLTHRAPYSTGTDVSGGSYIAIAGAGTGSAAASSFVVQIPTPTTSGSTQQTLGSLFQVSRPSSPVALNTGTYIYHYDGTNWNSGGYLNLGDPDSAGPGFRVARFNNGNTNVFNGVASMRWGSGNPEGVYTANLGQVWVQTDASTAPLWVKKSNPGANYGWGQLRPVIVGTATLVGGAATVSNTNVTAASIILLTSQADGGTPGWLRISGRSAGTSFTITSSSGTDTSTVGWQMSEP